MALTHDDLAQIRLVVEDIVKPLQNEMQALRSDVKEIYDMIAKLQSGAITDESFAKLSLKEKLFKINAELLVAAKQAGVTLPR